MSIRYPTDNNRITSQYGFRMINGRLDYHGGTDYGGKTPGVTGDPLYPIADDTILREINYDTVRGYNIVLEHRTHCTRYNHLEQGSIQFKENSVINKDQIVARMGNSGRSTAAHLHFEVHKCAYKDFHQKWANGEAKHTIDPELFFLTYMNKNEDCQTDQLIADIESVIEKYK